MNSRLTVADCRTALYSIVNPGDPDDPAFLSWLNQASERLMLSGKWNGMIVDCSFASASGYITLPPNFLSVLGNTYGGVPTPTFTQYHTYMENGPGDISSTEAFPYILIDLGDGFPTLTDIVEDSNGDLPAIDVYSSASDNGKIIRFYGLDADGSPVFDALGNEGVAVTLAAPKVTLSTTFSRITSVAKAATISSVTVRADPADGGTDYDLSVYLPSETRPMYRRYQVGEATQAIRCLCIRRFVPAVAETDWVYPGNLAALKYAMKSVFFEDADDFDNAVKNMGYAIEFLDKETKAVRGGGRAPLLINLFKDGQSLPNYIN